MFKFEIDRKSRSLARTFKRHPVKLEVWSKGYVLHNSSVIALLNCCCSGFLRSDSLLGTASIKLTDFEQKCQVHDTYQLFDGRKIVGGKVHARVRIREPLLAKQVEEVKEKWLVFD